MSVDDTAIERAADAIRQADAMLVGAGAGMGVDSGLPDFRGDEGFWKNYPPFEKRGLNFYDLANPKWFEQDPELAWGFYGHRLHLYRQTEPHRGFALLASWAESMSLSPFVFTSNVDGQFQKAGFDDAQILECHGTIHHLQCAAPCRDEIWPADGIDVDVDPESFRAQGDLPACRHCSRVARPNVLMFGDFAWIGDRTRTQKQRFDRWLERAAETATVVVECGAGTAVPTVRRRCEQASQRLNAPLVRINPHEAEAPADAVAIAAGAEETLSALDRRLPAT